MENQLALKVEQLELLKKQQELELATSPVGQLEAQLKAYERVGEMYAKSDLVPATFKKKENCAIAINMSMRMKSDPIMVMQNMYVVHGQPSLSSKMIIAMINQCGEFEPLRWEARKNTDPKDPSFGLRAYTYRKTDTEHKFRLEGTWVTNAMVQAEKWGSKWNTMPEQMFKYRSAVMWARTNAPEITMGFLSTEEVQEPSFNNNTVDAVAEEITDDKPKTLAGIASKAAMAKATVATKTEEPIIFEAPTEEPEEIIAPQNNNPKSNMTLL